MSDIARTGVRFPFAAQGMLLVIGTSAVISGCDAPGLHPLSAPDDPSYSTYGDDPCPWDHEVFPIQPGQECYEMQNLFGEETALELAAQMSGAIHETAPEECHDMAALAESHISHYNACVANFLQAENQVGRASLGAGWFVLREDMIEDGSLTTTGLFIIFHEALHLLGKDHSDFDPIGDDEGYTNFHNFASSCVEGTVGGGGGHPDPV